MVSINQRIKKSLENRGEEMIDIHSHIAWDIDYGFPNKEDSVEALLNAKRDGISSIVSTPHFVPGQLDQELFDLITKRQT